jgi:hypothetical protein
MEFFTKYLIRRRKRKYNGIFVKLINFDGIQSYYLMKGNIFIGPFIWFELFFEKFYFYKFQSQSNFKTKRSEVKNEFDE